MAKSPDDRFPSAGDLVRAAIAAAAGERPREHERLVAVGAAAPVESPTVTAGRLAPTQVQEFEDEAETRVQTDPGRRRRAGFAGVIAIALAAGVAVGAFLLNRGDEPQSAAGPTPTTTATATPGPSANAKVVAQVKVGTRPNVIGVNSHLVFVGSFREQRLALIDPETNKLHGHGPSVGVGMSAIDATNAAVWAVVSRQKKLYRLDPKTGRRIRAIAMPQQPTAVAMTSRSVWVGLITAVSGGPDMLVRVDRRSGQITAQYPVPEGISSLATGGGAVWIASRRNALLLRFDPAKEGVTNRIRVGSNRAYGVAYGAGAVWVTSPQDDLVSRVSDAPTFDVTRIAVGRSPEGIAVRGDDVFVANSSDNTVTRIDARTSRTVGDPIAVPVNPFAVAIAGHSVWVTCQPGNRVARIDYEPVTGRGG
jgi:DNA-binding beta-propeller fold protein YncE